MTGLPGSGYLGETSGAGAGMVLGEGDLCLAMLKGFQGPRSPHTGTCGLEDARVAEAVARGERLHHPVDLLGLARQPEAPEELPGGGAGLWAAGRVGALGGPWTSRSASPRLSLFILQMSAKLRKHQHTGGFREMPLFSLPECRAEFVLPSARLSPRTFSGPVHLSQHWTLCLSGSAALPAWPSGTTI